MENVRVEIIHSSLVQPSSPSPQPSLFLSSMDLLMRDTSYNRRVLFYDSPVSASGEDEYPLLISTLRRSLSEVLPYFYPLAGRFSGGVGDSRLAVACNDAGVEFVEACIHGVSFTDLQSSNFVMQPYFEQLTRWASYSSKLHEGSAPLFSVQVTRFPCGKIAMGIACSHVLADGFSLWHFMSSWAEHARGEPLSLYPSHERTLLRVDNPTPEKACFDTFEDSHTCGSTQEVKEQGVFSFNRDMVTKLKEMASNQYSTYEVLCAHIWKKASKARGHARDARIGFGNMVNMRGRIEPAMPSGYFGNVLLWGVATTSMGELQDEDLTTTASRMRASVRSCTHARMQQFLHFLELYGPAQVVAKALLTKLRMRASSSPKFPVMTCDFGWGRPLAVRSVVVEENGKLVYFTGPSGLGSVDVCIALPPPCMQHLENDPSFLSDLS